MQAFHYRTDVLIVGAGMAGLTAAAALQATGRSLLVIDKGRAVGGRLASRRIGLATFDHGARFMTARDPRFVAVIDQWRVEGVVEEWYRRSTEDSAEHPRWRGKPVMRAIARHLARSVQVLLETEMVALRRHPDGWEAALASGEAVLARAALLTAPVPQSLALIDTPTVTGRCFPSMMGAIHQMERELCAERAAVGRASAQAGGKTDERPRTDAAKLQNARISYENSEKTAAQAWAAAVVGRRTFFSYPAEFKKVHASGSEDVL